MLLESNSESKLFLLTHNNDVDHHCSIEDSVRDQA